MLILPSPPEGAEHFPVSGGFMYQGETYVPMSYALTRRDIQKLKAAAWDEGVATALNHAIRNPDGITLRLEHLDGRPWANPYRSQP